MADRHVDHLLIGGGIASASAAAALREGGASGSILLAGRELDAPYHRPPCTKGYLRGEQDKAATLVHPEGFWAEHDVELRTRTSVMSLDLEAKVAKLQSKEEISFGSALVATGAMVRRLQVDGVQLKGLHYVRALMNADQIRTDLEASGAKDVVLIGGSYVGCELAASLTQLGYKATVLMLEEEPMERGFGPTAGGWVRGLLEQHGVTVRGGVEVESFAGSGERIEEVVLAGGERIAAGAVIAGVGATPDVMLAKKSGLAIGDLGGVACDQSLRTSAEGIWAAGDMCEYHSVLHGREVRVEHEQVAAAQGAHVARAMLGSEEPFAEVPYFWSDLADWATLEHVGAARDWASEELTGDLDGGRFGIAYKDERGDVVAVLSVGGGGDLDGARAAMRERAGLPA